MIELTPRLLSECMQMPLARAAVYAAPMRAALPLAEINTDQRLACWLGQIGHETGHLRFLSEIWGPTSAQLRYERNPGAPWPKNSAQAKSGAFRANRLAYTLGNVRPGDGRRFMGRGGIQTTGRGNYRRLTKRLKALLGEATPDFETAPALLALPEWCFLSAADYWADRGLNRYADDEDLALLTTRVNGGLNGYADRVSITTHALNVFATFEE